MKTCFKCGIKKGLEEFYKHPDMPDGRVNKCKECNKKDVRENFAKKREYYNNYDKERIRHNFNYIFLHKFSSITERATGRNKKRTYNVLGKGVCSKEEFINWCYKKENLIKFQKIHSEWVKSNFDRKLCPSIDRIDNNKGYVLDNLQWLTVSANSKKYTF